MCGRFVAIIPAEALKEIFALIEAPKLEPRYNVAPTQMAAVVRNMGDRNRLDLLKWGLVPGWSKDLSFGSHLINARSETVAEKQRSVTPLSTGAVTAHKVPDLEKIRVSTPRSLIKPSR